MIGMGFSAFLTLLIIGLISSFVLQVLIQHRVLAGFEGFMFKWIVGWIGGWLGSPVFGYWSIHTGGVFIIPALLGAFSLPFLATAMLHGLVKAETRVSEMKIQPSTTQFEMKKAS